MTVRRVVPNLECGSLGEAAAFYVDVVGLEVVMDLGWIVTLADPRQPKVQISLTTEDETGPVVPVASIEVDDVDAAYRAARDRGAEIVHGITDEAWGVRRFFVRDPGGNVVNVLTHR
ncbi:MAG: VOC family protein [Solirubrobacteraceae bacterium]